MGVPVVEAPCEAEASCAWLAKAGKVYGTGTEDADALTFGTPFLIRHLNVAESRKLPIVEVNLEKALDGLGLSMAQFIDLCILCGCDYTDSIKGIGPISALKLIKQHGCIENVIKAIDTKKYPLPEPFPFEEARALFVTPDVVDCATPDCEFKWADCKAEELRKYLVEDKQFDEARVAKAIERMQKCKGKNSQVRLESFFGPTTVIPSEKKLAPKTLGKHGKGKQAAGGPAKKMKK
jgi:flap endonuclease-1